LRHGRYYASLTLILLAAAALIRLDRPAREAPRLVVMLVVDQMRYDFLTRFNPLYDSGFERLLDQGAVFSDVRYDHAATSTGPGHATIATGAHPSDSGIVSNSWYDSVLGEEVNCIRDDDYRAVGGLGSRASPLNLLAGTIGDGLKQEVAGTKVVGVSWKDRSAILSTGRDADAAYWFSTDCGCFVTSSYYYPEAPEWLTAFNSRNPADAWTGKSWVRLVDDDAFYRDRSREDGFPTEADGLDLSFPHRLPETAGKPYYDALSGTPFNDELVLGAALEAMRAHDLGADSEPDVLALGLSATDAVGHRYGPFSQEAMDQHLRLDRLLGRLLDELDSRVGLEHVVVALTADHGSIPLVEFLSRQGIDAGRVRSAELSDAVNSALGGDYVLSRAAGGLYLDFDALEANGRDRAAAERTAREALLGTGLVGEVYTHADLNRKDAAGDDPYLRLFRNSFYAQRSPHLLLRLKEGYYSGGRYGTGHGTSHDYDRHVPLILFGQGIRAGRYDAEAGPEDIAPTLGAILGVEVPTHDDTRILREALQ